MMTGLQRWLLLTVFAAATGVGTVPSKAANAGAGKDPVKIGFAVPVLENPYWAVNVQFAKQMAGWLGATLVVESANDQADKRLENIENLVAQGVSGVVFGPVDTNIGPAILRVCERNHIVCAAAERRPGVEPNSSNKDYFAGYVVGDDRDLGARMGALLYGANARKCVAMSGAEGNSVADLRLQGFKEYASSHAMAVLSVFRPAELAEDGQKATENFLAQLPGPGFDCLFGFDGDVGTGAISALSERGLTHSSEKGIFQPMSARCAASTTIGKQRSSMPWNGTCPTISPSSPRIREYTS